MKMSSRLTHGDPTSPNLVVVPSHVNRRRRPLPRDELGAVDRCGMRLFTATRRIAGRSLAHCRRGPDATAVGASVVPAVLVERACTVRVAERLRGRSLGFRQADTGVVPEMRSDGRGDFGCRADFLKGGDGSPHARLTSGVKVRMGVDLLMKRCMPKAGDIHHAAYTKNTRGRAIRLPSRGPGRIRHQNSGRR
jgi:hypothetical protein